MSESGKSERPVKQLSLQLPTSRRQQIRRQRSAEDDKSLQISVSPFARGKRGTSAKSGSERPKVRVAWTENRRKNEKELEKVEVVARQIPGRSKPITGKSKYFIGIDKPSILYSRQELAERLRLAWKHREETKPNINIFLARTVEERCDSEMSNQAITAPSSPSLKDEKILRNEQSESSEIYVHPRDNYLEKDTEDVNFKQTMFISKNDATTLKQDSSDSNFYQSCIETEENVDKDKNFEGIIKDDEASLEVEQEQLNEQTHDSSNVDCVSNTKNKAASTILPSIKTENATSISTKSSREDFSMAKQKRASFHSGTNKAFLEQIKPTTTEFRGNSVDKTVVYKPANVENKDTASNDKTVTPKGTIECKHNSVVEKSKAGDGKLNCTIEKNSRGKSVADGKDSIEKKVSVENKPTVQRVNEANKSHCLMKKNNSENRDNSATDKKNVVEIRCNSASEKSPPSKRVTESQKIDQRSRRTNSAPPQRHLLSASSNNNRVHVNIVIDTQSTGAEKNGQNKVDTEHKDNNLAADMTVTKISSGRAVKSAPLKRRSRSAKRRFWGMGSSKNDEEGRSRNRSNGRGKNSIDSRAIDIVTMVSLVSSADSDSDIENSPGDDKLINELRSKLPTTSIIKTSMNIARKPIKSVSFQKDSFDEDTAKEQQPSAREEKKTTQARLAIVNNRGNGGTPSSGEETVPWRTDVPGLALPVPALIHDAEDTIDIPLTDREKRCLAVPIGDLHDKKRKLLKTRSTPSRSEMEKQTISSKPKIQESPRILAQKPEVPVLQNKLSMDHSPMNVKETCVELSRESDERVTIIPVEPQFQTNKEKECWHLYRKMCDKGVCVSFDTVLRGMLTPTEYRLRQREVCQDL